MDYIFFDYYWYFITFYCFYKGISYYTTCIYKKQSEENLDYKWACSLVGRADPS